MTEPEVAISLREAARRLGLSYQTIFERREQIGFRLPGSRVWRVWPSQLANLTQRRYNVTRLALRSDTTGASECRYDSVKVSGGSIYARQAASELDDLLAQVTEKPRRNTTIA